MGPPQTRVCSEPAAAQSHIVGPRLAGRLVTAEGGVGAVASSASLHPTPHGSSPARRGFGGTLGKRENTELKTGGDLSPRGLDLASLLGLGPTSSEPCSFVSAIGPVSRRGTQSSILRALARGAEWAVESPRQALGTEPGPGPTNSLPFPAQGASTPGPQPGPHLAARSKREPLNSGLHTQR